MSSARNTRTEPDPEVVAVGTEFLDGLLEAFGLQATVGAEIVGDGITQFTIKGDELGVLIGPKAATLTAIQDLLRTIIHYDLEGDSGRILLDIAGYREKRRAALASFTRTIAAEVTSTGTRRALEPMSPADRKVVHDTVNDIEGVRSTSEGEEPTRYVVLLPE